MGSTTHLKMEKPFCEFSASCDSLSILPPQTSSPRKALNESYTIPKYYNEDNYLAVIYEENSECGNDSNMIYFKSFTNVLDLGECKNTNCVDQVTKGISISPECKKEINNDIEDFYDSDESLGLLPDLLEDVTYDSLILCKDYVNKDLNTTVNISDKYVQNFNDCLNYDLKHSNKEFVISPVCNKMNISSTQAESPVYCNQSMPVSASTPKHEISYLNVINEGVSSPQNMPDCNLKNISQDHNEEEKDLLNTTTVIEAGPSAVITNTTICLDSDENVNSLQNILNITCNMTKSMNIGETSLNKTFETLDALVDKRVLPSIVSNSEQDITESNVLNKTFEHHYSPEFDPDEGKENILNLTCHIVRESDTMGTANGEFSASLMDRSRDILNTTVSYPYVHSETPLMCNLNENKSDNIDQNNFQTRTGDILNNTYEKIDVSVNYDTSSEKLKCITNIEEKRPLQLGTVSKKRRVLSFSAKNVTFEKNGIKNKDGEFNRNKNMRRSFGCFGKTNVIRTDSVKQTSRKSLASSICPVSKVPEIKENLLFPKSLLPKHVENVKDKSSLIKGGKVANMNPSYLNKTIKCMPLKLSDNKSRVIKDISKIKPEGSQESLLNTTINLHPNSISVDKTTECLLKTPKCKSKDIKLLSKDNLKGSQESLLNATINLLPSITDTTKTVIKKQRNSMMIRNTKEICSNSCLSPPTTDPTKTVIKKPRNSVLIKDTKDGSFDFSLNPPINDVTKTVIKKPRNSMLISDKKNCLNSCKLPFGKDIKSAIPSFQKRVFTRESQARVVDITQESNANKTSALSNKIGLKDTASVEEKMNSRLPQKSILQKIKFQSDLQSSMKPSSNVPKPQSITGIQPPTASMKSLSLLKKPSNKGSEFCGKAVLTDTLPCQKSKEQSTKSIEPLTTTRKSLFIPSKKCSNKGSELAGKAILNNVLPCQKSKEQNTEVFKKFASSSKIPSISHLPQRRKD